MTTLTTLKITLRKGARDFDTAMEGQLTFPQYQVLDAVRNAEETPSQTYIVDATGIDRSTVADIVRRLVERRLLSRRRKKEDMRTYQTFVTDAGLDLLRMGDKQLRPIERSLTLAEAAE